MLLAETNGVVITAVLAGVGGLIVGILGAWAGYQEKKANRDIALNASRMVQKAEEEKAEAVKNEAHAKFVFAQFEGTLTRIRKEYEEDRARIERVHAEHLDLLKEAAKLTERTASLEAVVAERDRQLVICNQRVRELEARVKHLEQMLDGRGPDGGHK